MKDELHEQHIGYKPLIIGFLLSTILTIAAFLFVALGHISGFSLDVTLLGLAFFQAFIQLICFFHLGSEAKPRFKLLMFFFMLIIVTIVVTGSIWIMKNLDYNLMVDMTY